MVILLCGGGSGGHITPLLAVAKELKARAPEAKIVYIGEKHGRFGHLVKAGDVIDKVYLINAGKFRRYHKQNWLARLIDIKTIALNLRDLLRVCRGILESRRILGRENPVVVFIKGGFVGVPVGLSCATAKIPYITHDSDTMPGLANRLIGRWAAYHATGMPAELYSYPRHKTGYIGIPLASVYQPVSEDQKRRFKAELGIPTEALVLLVTGGSLGAKRLNKAFGRIADKLLVKFPDLIIIHQTGHLADGLYSELDSGLAKRLRAYEFMENIYAYSGAADLVITRAGATAIAELAVQGKAVVLVPNPELTGGHQLANAQYLIKANAAAVVTEAELANNSDQLFNDICGLLNSQAARASLASNLSKLAKPAAAKELAEIMLTVAKAKLL